MNTIALNDSTIFVKNTHFSPNILHDGSWVLYNDESNDVVVLNSSAGILWELYTGIDTIEQVVLQLSEYYPDKPLDELHQEVYKITPILIEKNTISYHNKKSIT